MLSLLTGKREKIDIRENEYREGGQAVVYFPLSHPDNVVKVYKKRPAGDEIEKLNFMIAHPPEDPARANGHISFAWPKELVYDSAMNVVGYVMPRIQKSATLLDVFNPHRRRVLKLQLDWRFLHGVAANLASAIAALHEKKYILGDINEGNVLVNNRALVTLIDVDSFQVEVGSKVFPCPVGKEEYTPREVLAKGFHSRREACSDGFGLAVLIYQLLLEGNHPFRGVWKGGGEPPPVGDKIRQGYFPYAERSPNQPFPALRPAFGDLLPEIQQYFLRAFVDGHQDPYLRPAAAEWQKALRMAMHEIHACPVNASHFYFSHSRTCPWCSRKSAAPPVQRRPVQPANVSPAASSPPAGPGPTAAQTEPKTTEPKPAAANPVTTNPVSSPPRTAPRPAASSGVSARPAVPAASPASSGVKGRPAVAAAQPQTGQPLILSKTLLDFGTRFGGSRSGWRKLTLRNAGPKPLVAWLITTDAWISFSDNSLIILPGEKKDVRVKLDYKQISSRAGEKNGMVFVRYTGGIDMQFVRVKANILLPDLYLSTRACSFTASNSYQKMVQEIRVKNLGRGTLPLALKLTTRAAWISVSPQKIDLSPGKSEVLRVIVTPAAVSAKSRQETLTGKIQVRGPGGYRADIEVRLKRKLGHG